MENRSNNRTEVHLTAEIGLFGKSHECLAENLSENGLCVTTSPTVSAKDFIPGTSQEVKLKLPSGETIDVHCEVRWLHSFILESLRVVNSLGMQLITKPPEYLAYLKTLQ